MIPTAPFYLAAWPMAVSAACMSSALQIGASLMRATSGGTAPTSAATSGQTDWRDSGAARPLSADAPLPV